MEKLLRVIRVLSIFTAAAFSVVILNIYLAYYFGEYAIVTGILTGFFSGAFITRRFVRKYWKDKIALLEKDNVRLADEKRQAQLKTADYMTQTIELNSQIKELKNFREGVAGTIKTLASQMNRLLGEDRVQPKHTSDITCIKIRKDELVLGRPLAS